MIFPHVVGALDWIWQKDQAKDLKVTQSSINDPNGDVRAALPKGDISLTSDSTSWSLGVGPGIAVRYWFRKDHYHAPDPTWTGRCNTASPSVVAPKIGPRACS
ncbi:NfrA family protein [Pseudomonas sp. NY15354]|uniref:NfrA family protein n=1 Tax=Pseudomonas sp. NY15354 TaxID=3400351 RepID=UPI003A8B5CA2